MKHSRESGLTIVELAIVVTILAMVVAVALSEMRRRQAIAATGELPDAVTRGDFQRVAELIKRGADVNTVRPKLDGDSDLGWAHAHSMLSLAIRLRHPDVARLLLRHGADPNGDQPGNTRQPLYWAAYTHDAKIFDALIEAGADLEFKLNGHTAYQFAKDKYDNVEKFLKERGAKQ